ncbi:MAG: Fe(3+) ABC transporter substrate-binding protein, partial [Campylobacter lanienae]|nr:Fe(3+) ABC transporter substrate-binding protein [Campylobacteraceae bacterium]MDY2817722.1 Fe(3+) ABC transporter substrate-binding protein [Campylobacter lanienae]
KKFMEFMLSKDVQTMLTNINYEFPVRSDVVPSDIVKEFGKFKEDSIEVSKIAENVKDAVLIYDEVGFR